MPINSFDQYPLSWKPEREGLTRPYYASLLTHLEEEIRSGHLAAGTKLPPQRELADFLDLNYTTITRVYTAAKKKGLVYGIIGKGTFVAPHAKEDITIAEQKASEDVIELGFISGFSECTLPVEKALARIMAKGNIRSLLDYRYIHGHPHQLMAASRWLSQMGVTIAPSHISIFTGAENALSVALASLFQKGDAIAVDEYTYSNFIELANIMELTLVPIRGDRNGMQPEQLALACQKRKIRGIYLMPGGSNPTNVCIPEGRRRMLSQVIKKYDLLLMEDDLYGWISASTGQPLRPLFEMVDRKAFYICSTTKNLCPGLRIAFGAYKEDIAAPLLRGLANMNIKTSSLDAEIITELILSGAAYDLIRQKLRLAKEAGELFDSYFPKVQEGTTSFFRWLPISKEIPGPQVEAELLARGVHVYHSYRFQVTGEPKTAYLRVALSSAGSLRNLKKGLGILKEYLE